LHLTPLSAAQADALVGALLALATSSCRDGAAGLAREQERSFYLPTLKGLAFEGFAHARAVPSRMDWPEPQSGCKVPVVSSKKETIVPQLSTLPRGFLVRGPLEGLLALAQALLG
jgi:hypothetical protein